MSSEQVGAGICADPDTELADTKMDGLACAITYQDGVFTQAVTRGDGTVGRTLRQCTHHRIGAVALRRTSISSSLPAAPRSAVIVMLKSVFNRLNEENQAAGCPLANP
jgi:DNA ligase (NAD+)